LKVAEPTKGGPGAHKLFLWDSLCKRTTTSFASQNLKDGLQWLSFRVVYTQAVGFCANKKRRFSLIGLQLKIRLVRKETFFGHGLGACRP